MNVLYLSNISRKIQRKHNKMGRRLNERMNKSLIRKEVKQKKSGLDIAFVNEYSNNLSDIFCMQHFYSDATVIYPYLAYNTEIITKPIIERAWSDGKRVAVPKVISDGVMEFYYIDGFSQIEIGYCGIPEPITDGLEVAADKDVLILMPGLAFDKELNRIGYGGGFYDRYLERGRASGVNFTKVSLAYDFQVFDKLEVEAHDEKIDVLITKDFIVNSI